MSTIRLQRIVDAGAQQEAKVEGAVVQQQQPAAVEDGGEQARVDCPRVHQQHGLTGCGKLHQAEPVAQRVEPGGLDVHSHAVRGQQGEQSLGELGARLDQAVLGCRRLGAGNFDGGVPRKRAGVSC